LHHLSSLFCVLLVGVIEKTSKISTVNLRVYGQEEDQDLDGGRVFAQILKRDELQIGGKHLGMGLNGRRALRKRRSNRSLRASQ
jgi:hypothetical protein